MRYHSPFFRLPQSIAHAVALVALSAPGAAFAQAQSGPTYTFGGFGTVGVAHSDYDQADYSSTSLKAKGAGATSAWSPDLDSRLGAQLSVRINKQWSGVIQVISEQRYNGSYKPVVEWGNIKYQATPDLSLRVGRIALPIFLSADYRKVGYAYPWVRTPVEVYGGVPITNSDGADATFRWQSGRVKHVSQAFFGKTHVHLTDTTYFRASEIAGLTHTVEYGALTVRASAVTAVLDTNILLPLFKGFRQFGPKGIAIADKYDVIDKRINIVALGVNYDPGKWFVMAEGGFSNNRSYLGKSGAMFISAGYRAGEFTPYVTYARKDARSPTSDPGLSTAGLPPAFAFAASQLNVGLDKTLKTIASQTTMSTGMRWDFRPDMALKLQVDRIEPRGGSRGTLVNLKPGFRSGRPIHVTSATLDFVF